MSNDGFTYSLFDMNAAASYITDGCVSLRMKYKNYSSNRLEESSKL